MSATSWNPPGEPSVTHNSVPSSGPLGCFPARNSFEPLTVKPGEPPDVSVSGIVPAAVPSLTMEVVRGQALKRQFTFRAGVIRIERGHDAALPQVDRPHQGRADLQDAPFPAALCQPGDAADHQIRAEAPAVDAQRGDGAVGGDQQRQHVEALEAVEALQPGVTDLALKLWRSWEGESSVINRFSVKITVH